MIVGRSDGSFGERARSRRGEAVGGCDRAKKTVLEIRQAGNSGSEANRRRAAGEGIGLGMLVGRGGVGEHGLRGAQVNRKMRLDVALLGSWWQGGCELFEGIQTDC